MSALDVLAARRRVLVSGIEKEERKVSEMQDALTKQKRALESIDNATEVLASAGFVREWDDENLDKMLFRSRG